MKLTVPQAARRMGRSPETIRRWIWSGKLSSEKVGNQHLVDEADLGALEAASEVDEGDVVNVPGPWGEWLRQVDVLSERLRADGVRLPPAADLVRESRRGR